MMLGYLRTLPDLCGFCCFSPSSSIHMVLELGGCILPMWRRARDHMCPSEPCLPVSVGLPPLGKQGPSRLWCWEMVHKPLWICPQQFMGVLLLYEELQAG